MTGLSLGLDLGTSGVRSAVIDDTGTVLSQARGSYPDASGANAESWWSGAWACLHTQMAQLRTDGGNPADIARMAVDGTSGSVVLLDEALQPVTRALMYHDSGFTDEADQIARFAPDPHITRGPGSALARVMRLQAEADPGAAKHLAHQADFIAARLSGVAGTSDHNNALKTGFDPETGTWPDWFAEAGVSVSLLPKVLPVGAPVAQIQSDLGAQLGLSPDVVIHAGTTDSIAAFLAAAPLRLGAAVTSLGTTLAIKTLGTKRIDAPEIGLYSHRLGDLWLVGGASNTGGGVLAHYFTPEEIVALSDRIDPAIASELDYYPLIKSGERFPINDPDLQPKLSPRPVDDSLFLGGLFEGIARIEAQCYTAIRDRGGEMPTELFTAGGGAQNAVFTAIRERVLGMPISVAESAEAAIGTARLARLGSKRS
ncbi:FGGY-family carbohydrate kinase [Gymnodinialimonas hymeniacidonis]|uniref:FGGY-family carbohydrate kinase n=1 Tax=Gymnodinialimonas hymeniacidonis TaxID=3126508 RepID=UPI0034C69437